MKSNLKADQQLVIAPTDESLNDDLFWKNISSKVWEFFIGGYQIIKKWLSYREFEFLGRPLTTMEADEVTAMVRRLTTLCLMQPELDANYSNIKEASYMFPAGVPATVAVDEDLKE
jgi:Type ISP C-terminal specificity domain